MRTRSPNRLIVCSFLFLGILYTASTNETQKVFEFGRPLHRFFSTREYRADNQNWAAVQDRQGLLLFGNDSLVLQYDGQRWEHIRVPGGSTIQALAVDDRGQIWVGGVGQLGRLVGDGDRYKFQSAAGEKGLPANFGAIGQIVPDGETEFVRSEKALLVYAGNEWKSIAWPHGNGFDYMLSSIDKRVFVHSRNDPVYDETALAIEILPPWYRTWWMYSIYGVLCVLGILGFVRLRVWRLRVREKELVAIVAERAKELEESQAKLVEAKEAAEAANRAKSTFLANISHELRTPLNSILGYTQLMLRDENESEEKRRRLTTVLSSGEHLLNMINEILDLAKVESGTIVVNLQPVQLKPLLNTLADEFQLRANQKQLRFTYSSDHSIQEWISTDPIRLKQVLYNLVGNSIKFTETGEVVLRVSRVKECIRIEVRDTGRGIPADEIQHLFKPFYQATNNNQASGGVGLGLYISQRIVRLLGGSLEVSSKEGEGSNFWFELPASAANAAPALILMRKVLRFEGDATRILVVDDDLANRQYMLDLLQEVGLRATFAPSAIEGLQLIRKAKFDCVISDIRMPGLSGIEFCQELRKDPQFASLPMIASSASVYENDRETALAAGFNGFVPKPISETLLFGLFESLLELKPVYGTETEKVTEFEGAEDAVNRPLSESLPDMQRLGELLLHAKLGDIIALRSAILKLAEKNGELKTFSRRLTILADQYQMSAIEKILVAAREVVQSTR